MKASVFDFDGTLTQRDTVLPMAFFLAMKGDWLAYIRFIYYYICFKCKIHPNEVLKKKFALLFLKDKNKTQICELTYSFLENHISLKEEIYDAFLKAISNDGKVFIISANFDFVIHTWVSLVKAKNVIIIATILEETNGSFTGEIIGEICRGRVKAEKLKNAINIERYYITSFADEESDKYIMSLANQKNWVLK